MTDYDLLSELHDDDFDGLSQCFTFCIDAIIIWKTISCFLNNKPWIENNIKVFYSSRDYLMDIGGWIHKAGSEKEGQRENEGE